jgi:hypothetical protein
VSAAEERLAEKFRQNYGFTPSLEIIKRLIRAHVGTGEYGMVRDKKHHPIPDTELQGMCEESIREVGREIATSVVRAWDKNIHDFDNVQIVGGGAHYFAKDIQSRIAHAKKSHRPGMANADGYVKLAEVAMTRALAAGR